MLRSCLVLIVSYALLFAGYCWWLGRMFDPPGLWLGAGAAALLVGGSLGALYNARVAYREWSLIAAARHDLPWSDGRWAAVTGQIHPVGDPVAAPFSGAACVLCEYDVASQHRIGPTSREPGGTPGVDFTGFLMNPCVVRSRTGEARLLGFPNLVEFGKLTLATPAAARNAREFLLKTQFEDRSGLKMVSVFSAILAAWNDDDGLVRINIRLGKTLPADLFPPELERKLESLPAAGEEPADASEWTEDELDEEEEFDEDEFDDAELDDQELAAEDEDDEDEDDEDELDAESERDVEAARNAIRTAEIPLLQEQRVRVGEQVCAIGVYDAARRGLVPGGIGGDRFIKLIRGREADLEGLARSKSLSSFIGGIVGLVVIHLAAAGAMLAFRLDITRQREWEQEAVQIASDPNGSIWRLATLVGRGVDVNGEERGSGLLAFVQDPRMARWLIDHGADVNGRSSQGLTPLMIAARSGNEELVRVLILAGADVNLKSSDFSTTALTLAVLHGKLAVADLLRQAGATDDAPTAPQR